MNTTWIQRGNTKNEHGKPVVDSSVGKVSHLSHLFNVLDVGPGFNLAKLIC